jgi:hypothetical protein
MVAAAALAVAIALAPHVRLTRSASVVTIRVSSMTSGESPHVPTMPPRRFDWSAFLLLLLVFSVGTTVRVCFLGAHGLFLDELWSTEIATGRGSEHLQLPLDQVMQPPELLRLDGAPPWWQVWTRMEITQPPLYWLALRGWMRMFGETDVAERTPSVVASVAAIALLFDAARLLNGTAVAFWAGLLMALAQPQVEFGRQVKNYALLVLVAMIAIDALVRIELLGVTRRRCIALSLAVLAMLLTHYFSVGAIAALALYAILRLRGRTRRDVLLAIIVAGVIFAIAWGPFMWRQRAMFSTQDDQTQFLQNTATHPGLFTLQNLLLVPSRLLAVPRDRMVTVSMALSVLFILPFVRRRSRSDLLLWGLLLAGAVAPLLVLDLLRHTIHLWFIRYSLIAGPAVYVLIPGALAHLPHSKWAMHLLAAAATLQCALAVRDVYHPVETDPRLITSEMGVRMGPQDLVVFGATGHARWMAGAQYLALERYQHPIPSPVAMLDAPATGEVLQRARASRYVFVFTVGDDPTFFLPGFRTIDSRFYIKGGIVTQLAADSTPPH